MKKEYKKEDIKVVWEPKKCAYSTICKTNLASVFKPRERPWVQTDGASKEEIVRVVHMCPSGALSIKKD